MSQPAPLRGKLGQCSGQVRRVNKFQVKMFIFLALLQAFGRLSGLLQDRHHPRSNSELRRGEESSDPSLAVNDLDTACEGGLLRIKNALIC